MKMKEIELEKSVHGGVFKRLLKYAVPYFPQMAFALLLVLAVTGFDLYRPAIVGKALDTVIEEGSFDGIVKLSIIYFLVLVGGFVCNFLQTWILQLTGQTIIYNIRQEVFAHVHKLSLRYFDITPVGRIVTRVTNDVEALNEMYANILK